MEEVRFMDRYLDSYDVFFVFNKINLIDDDERDDVKSNIVARVKQARNVQRSDRYYFVNAKAAVKATLSSDEALWRTSGLGLFTKDLGRFLVDERHRAKVVVTVRDIRRIVRQLQKRVPEQRALTDADATSLQRRYAEAEAPLRELEARTKQIRSSLEQRVATICDDARARVTRRLVEISDEMPQIIATVSPGCELSLAPWKVKSASEAYAEAISEKAGDEITARFSAWAKDELGPAIGRSLQEIAVETNEVVNTFLDDLQVIRERLTGIEGGDDAEARTLFDDVVGRIGQSGLSGLGTLDASVGVGNLVKQILATMGVMVVWAFTPLGIIPLVIAVVVANTALLGRAKEKIATKVRSEISAALAVEIRRNAPANGDQAAELMAREIQPVIDGVMATIEGRVGELRAQVETALDALEKGTGQLETRRRELTVLEGTLDGAGQELEDLLADVVVTT
jgi:hypothetical protein